MNRNHFIISSGIMLCGCIMIFAFLSFDKASNRGYDLSAPSVKWSLPDTLREISGITVIDESTVACIQDENGIVFLFDMNEGEIVRQHPFYLNGDYEGITRAGKSIYVLRSDGMLFAIRNYKSAKPQLDSIVTNIPVDNNEGLCFDAAANRLLIACKNKAKSGKHTHNERWVYAYDLQKRQCTTEPVLKFDQKTVTHFAKEKDIPFPAHTSHHGKKKQKEPVIKFRPSEIAIHPVTHQIYLLSAMDYALFVYTPEGKLTDIRLLDKEIFNKSEGITFMDNGDMLISNEGQQKKPTLLRFNYDPE